jgi:hypothetical protein
MDIINPVGVEWTRDEFFDVFYQAAKRVFADDF